MLKKKSKKVEEDFFKDDSLPSKWKMRKRINTLESERDLYKQMVEEKIVECFFEKLGEPDKIKRQNKEIRRLKELNKKLKEESGNANSKK